MITYKGNLHWRGFEQRIETFEWYELLTHNKVYTPTFCIDSYYMFQLLFHRFLNLNILLLVIMLVSIITNTLTALS